MTAEQRENIGRGVRIAAMRKRQSEAMKASWVRRRKIEAQKNGAITAPTTRRANLRDVAELLGIDTDAVIRHEIKRILGI